MLCKNPKFYNKRNIYLRTGLRPHSNIQGQGNLGLTEYSKSALSILDRPWLTLNTWKTARREAIKFNRIVSRETFWVSYSRLLINRDYADTFSYHWNFNSSNHTSANCSWGSFSTVYTTLKRETCSRWQPMSITLSSRRELSKVWEGIFIFKIISNADHLSISKDSSLSVCCSSDTQQPSKNYSVIPTMTMLLTNLDA